MTKSSTTNAPVQALVGTPCASGENSFAVAIVDERLNTCRQSSAVIYMHSLVLQRHIGVFIPQGVGILFFESLQLGQDRGRGRENSLLALQRGKRICNARFESLNRQLRVCLWN